MDYSVGDKVEVRAKLRDGTPSKTIWKLWLMEIIPMIPNATDQLWIAKFTRVSHAVLIQESWFVRKLSSNFEEFFPKTEAIEKF